MSRRYLGSCFRDAGHRAAYVADITGLRISVLADACATFDAPGVHDAAVAHHVGLWLMSSRGAEIASSWSA